MPLLEWALETRVVILTIPVSVDIWHVDLNHSRLIGTLSCWTVTGVWNTRETNTTRKVGENFYRLIRVVCNQMIDPEVLRFLMCFLRLDGRSWSSRPRFLMSDVLSVGLLPLDWESATRLMARNATTCNQTPRSWWSFPGATPQLYKRRQMYSVTGHRRSELHDGC